MLRTISKPELTTVARLMLVLLTLISFCTGAAQPLRPDKAFQYDVSATADEIIVRWDIEEGYYLYKKRMSFVGATQGITLSAPRFPQGETHEDEFFGKSEVFRGEAEVRIPYEGSATSLTLKIMSQGCADMGLCYPPQTWETSVALPAPANNSTSVLQTLGRAQSDAPLPASQAFQVNAFAIEPFMVDLRWTIADGYYIYKDQISVRVSSGNAQAGAIVLPTGVEVDDLEYGITEVYYNEMTARLPLSRGAPAAELIELDVFFQGCKTDSICYPPQSVRIVADLPEASIEDGAQIGAPVSEQSRLAAMIGSGNLLAVMGVFVGLGLLLAFTPCVLPMVPILSGIIAGQGKNITALGAFLLSLTYVLGMAVTYTLAGALFAAAGQQVQALLQQPWIIAAVAALFVALALSMFGFFNLQMPSALQTRLNNLSSQQRTGTFIGTAIMGALSALVVTTCVAPPLVATLTVIAETGDVLRGGAALFALSMGMGLPLLVIGTSAGKLLPRAGAWMDSVKEIFGFMMLGLAVWMLERLLDGAVTMWLWSALVAAAGVRLWMQSSRFSAGASLLSKAASVLLACLAAAVLAAGLQGGTNPLQSFAVLSGEQMSELPFIRIKSTADLDEQLDQARSQGEYVMLDFYADWCVSCKEMEHYTFTDSSVQQALQGVRLLQADVTANDAEDQALLQRMGIFGPPTIVFFAPDGSEVAGRRVIGFQSADIFSAHVNETVGTFDAQLAD